MFDFFLSNDYPIQHAVKKYTMFEYISRRYLQELTKIMLYYRKRNGVVDNTNLFSRLITLISPNIDLDIGDYFKYSDANTKYITRQFKFTSNISMGKVHENVFYKNNEYVIINHIDTDIDIFKLKDNWKNRTPVRVIYTTETDLDFYTFNSTKSTYEDTITVVEIDTTLMLMMYKYWCKERIAEGNSTNPNSFVYNIVLPNMIKTILDLIVFNRMKKIFYGEPIRPFVIKHPFNVLDYSKNIDNILRDVIKDISNTNSSLEQMLLTIPTIVYPNMIDALYIRRPIYTKASEWSIWISRLEYIVFLIDLMGERGVTKNRQYVYRLPVYIKELENRSTTIVDKLPNCMLYMYYSKIEEIKRKIGRR